MEQLATLFAGAGVVGTVLAWILATVFLFVIPILAIIDCAASAKHRGSRAIIIILLILTWSAGGVIYALFFAGSRTLRVLTSVAIVAILALSVFSMVSCVVGAGTASSAKRQEIEQMVAEFDPAEVTPDEVGAVTAISFVDSAASLARFTLAGPEPDSARNIDRDVRHVALDPTTQRCFALTTHGFGTITPSTGHFAEIAEDPSLEEFSWPKGLAFDAVNRRVYIVTSHVYTRFYVYDPGTSDWQRLAAEHRDLPLVALAYSAAHDALFALAHSPSAARLSTVHCFNTLGALTGTVDLSPAIPVPDRDRKPIQLQASGSWLVLVVPAHEQRDIGMGSAAGVFAIDPAKGTVFRAPRGRKPPLESLQWQ